MALVRRRCLSFGDQSERLPRDRGLTSLSLECDAVLLARMGAAGAVADFRFVAAGTARLLIRLAFSGANYVPIDPAPSLPVLGFAFLLSVVTGVVFGIAPAWSASRADPAAVLRGAGRSAGGRSSLPQRTLVVVQVALAVALQESVPLPLLAI